ncbi:hypothetical protein SARC_05235 [Sphaeroforma arctica JP610]|uniref:Uncharacterized protein n=1 Tax=Sphaeroforma arctica JP610 TaxID=667725 RepID=A0A0L0G2Q7_9EUKA|nr:hypothetical protein SARC_05235 [Sphaeroforma arctica JP610]KNC82483.1 hypothetical protein SARC_05235 [Sphaeroforma arctica JP610]|eukprot:XP_014156385.1 hypothetical protein SARC_05235 [Sphaeroforma arctica JP610]
MGHNLRASRRHKSLRFNVYFGRRPNQLTDYNEPVTAPSTTVSWEKPLHNLEEAVRPQLDSIAAQYQEKMCASFDRQYQKKESNGYLTVTLVGLKPPENSDSVSDELLGLVKRASTTEAFTSNNHVQPNEETQLSSILDDRPSTRGGGTQETYCNEQMGSYNITSTPSTQTKAVKAKEA